MGASHQRSILPKAPLQSFSPSVGVSYPPLSRHIDVTRPHRLQGQSNDTAMKVPNNLMATGVPQQHKKD